MALVNVRDILYASIFGKVYVNELLVKLSPFTFHLTDVTVKLVTVKLNVADWFLNIGLAELWITRLVSPIVSVKFLYK